MTNVHGVFVADDDLSARKGLVRLLRTAGYHVREFSSATELLDALRSEVPECVVLEVRMLWQSNLEQQTEFSVCAAQVPIIIVSVDDDPQSRRIALKTSAVEYFSKPVDGTALLDAINWALQSGASYEASQTDD